MTFNQFFAREVKPGKRPIAEPWNDKVIVSPAESVFEGAWDIDPNSKVTVKGVTWPIAKLLEGSPYRDAFKSGIYTHTFLNGKDYHRYHVPVAGEIKEVRRIQGRVYMDMIRTADGRLQAIDGDTYQYNQERGLIIIDSPEVGLVAVLPIGMGPISSVNLTPEVGARLQKGDEFGFFMFGGSDIVMLFQNKKVVINAEVGKSIRKGSASERSTNHPRSVADDGKTGTVAPASDPHAKLLAIQLGGEGSCCSGQRRIFDRPDCPIRDLRHHPSRLPNCELSTDRSRCPKVRTEKSSDRRLRRFKRIRGYRSVFGALQHWLRSRMVSAK